MKYSIIYLSIIFLLISNSVLSQNSSDLQEHRVDVKAIVVGDTVKLKWMPSDIDVWRDGIDYGYRLTRRIQNDTMTIEEEANTAVVLVDSLKPYTESEWNANFSSNDNALLVKDILYDDSLKYQYNANPDSIKLSDAVRYQDNEDERFLFSMMLSEQDYAVAKGLGLGYVDVDVEDSVKYIYMVHVNYPENESHNYLGGVVAVTLSDAVSLPQPQDVSAAGGDHTVMLSWLIAGMEDYYAFYNIERKEIGDDSFEVLNENPFIYMTDAKAESDFAFYVDSLVDNTTEYAYRIVGLSSFGGYGSPSDTVHAKGKEPILNLQISIDSTSAEDNSIYIKWNISPDSLRSKLDHFDILRLKKIDDTVTVINPNALAKTDSIFEQDNPIGAGYYIVEATDINQYKYRSIAKLLQLADTIPPAKPTGLTGFVRDDGKVTMDWDANTEDDLKGYKVVYSNKIDGEYSQLTSLALVKPHFETFIDLKFGLDSIFLKVFAVDNRYNMSELSDPLALERPDINAPSQAIIKQLIAYDQGIAVYWALSETDDLVKHELQRKIANTPNWETVISFDVGKEPDTISSNNSLIDGANYLDLDTLKFNTYKYRLLAYDDAGNISYSKEKSVFPYDDGIRGVLSDFEGYLIPFMPVLDYVGLTTNFTGYSIPGNLNGPSSTVLNLLSGSTSVNVPPAPPGQFSLADYKKAVAFKWKYSTEFENLRSFKLYRRIVFQQGLTTIGGTNSGNISYSNFVLTKSISPEDAARLAQMVGYDGYIFVDDYPQRGVVHYEYKIIAEHYDGGRSKYSDIITVQTFGN